MPKTSREESLTLEIRLTSSALSHSFHIRKVFNPTVPVMGSALEKFLQRGGGAFHHLACGDAVDQLLALAPIASRQTYRYVTPPFIIFAG
jgi:hypothetical protein